MSVTFLLIIFSETSPRGRYRQVWQAFVRGSNVRKDSEKASAKKKHKSSALKWEEELAWQRRSVTWGRKGSRYQGTGVRTWPTWESDRNPEWAGCLLCEPSPKWIRKEERVWQVAGEVRANHLDWARVLEGKNASNTWNKFSLGKGQRQRLSKGSPSRQAYGSVYYVFGLLSV